MPAMSEHKFASLSFRDERVEFVPNDQGQVDLYFWNLGSAKHSGCRRLMPHTIYTRLDPDSIDTQCAASIWADIDGAERLPQWVCS